MDQLSLFSYVLVAASSIISISASPLEGGSGWMYFNKVTFAKRIPP